MNVQWRINSRSKSWGFWYLTWLINFIGALLEIFVTILGNFCWQWNCRKIKRTIKSPFVVNIQDGPSVCLPEKEVIVLRRTEKFWRRTEKASRAAWDPVAEQYGVWAPSPHCSPPPSVCSILFLQILVFHSIFCCWSWKGLTCVIICLRSILQKDFKTWFCLSTSFQSTFHFCGKHDAMLLRFFMIQNATTKSWNLIIKKTTKRKFHQISSNSMDYFYLQNSAMAFLWIGM